MVDQSGGGMTRSRQRGASVIRGWLGVRKAYGMSIINCVVRLSI